ncbi:MAG: outer membrane beta-barrel protein, partial [Candidatus Aminicenantales bacterium]
DEVLYDTALLGRSPGAGNSIDQLQDYGAELGGPAVKDILWLWGSYGRNQIDLVVPGGTTDKTTLFNYSFKLNFQPVPENSFNAQFLNNDKQKFGRGAGPDRPQETTLDQSGPTKIYKLEDSHIFSPDMFATATYARVMGGFGLLVIGRGQTFLDTNGVYHNSYEDYVTQRPQTTYSIAPNFFFRTGSVGHELKVGFNYRKTPITSVSSFPTGIVGIQDGGVLFGINPTGQDLAMFFRTNTKDYSFESYSGFLSDTLRVGKLTAQIGVRYDYQWGANSAFKVPAPLYNQADYPQAPMTGLDVPGTDPLIWKDFSPRVGLSYSIDDKTIARASYARFSGGMSNLNVNQNSAAPGIGTYLFYPWNDANGNQQVDPGEADFSNLVTYIGWDPAHPNNVDPNLVNNKVDYNMKSPKTDEFVLGFEHSLLPEFLVGLSGTYRKFTDFTQFVQLTADGSRPMNPSDFVCTEQGPYPVPNGSAQFVNVCNPNPGVAGIGSLERTRPDYYQTYWGVDFVATKRYSNKWMARFNFTYSDWTQHDTSGGGSGLSAVGGYAGNGGDPSNLVGGSTADGGPVLNQSGGSGSKGFVYINSKWQGTLSAMYTLPLDFNISTTMFARQGFAAPYYVNINSANNPLLGSKNYQLGNADDFRTPTVFEWDLGLGKAVRIGGLTATIQADCFNVLNRATELQRNLRLRSTETTANAIDNYVYEIQSPRIWRLGVRLGF